MGVLAGFMYSVMAIGLWCVTTLVGGVVEVFRGRFGRGREGRGG